MPIFTLFNASDETNGSELWITDGTPAGTSLLKDINPGANGGGGTGFTALGNGKVVFASYSAGFYAGFEPWVTDGTAAGTSQLKDINTNRFGRDGSYPGNFSSLDNGKALFTAQTSANGRELWITDGTQAGTSLLKDIVPGPGGSGAIGPVAVLGKDKAVFAVNDGTNGTELWFTDGTTAGTSLLKDIRAGGYSSDPKEVTPIGGGKAVFSADDGSNGRELWVTDGTKAGTTLLKDINPGAGIFGNPNSSYAQDFTPVGGGRVVFRASGPSGYGLWVTDGTQNGTSLLTDRVFEPRYITALDGDRAVFSVSLQGTRDPQNSGTTDLQQAGIWVTDGTDAGTSLVKNIFAFENQFEFPRLLAAVGGGKVAFHAFSGSTGHEPWITDGTEAGTFLLADINPGSASSAAAGDGVTDTRRFSRTADGSVVFLADDGTNGAELWVTDGTSGGTSLLKDIFPAGSFDRPDALASLIIGNRPVLASPLAGASATAGKAFSLTVPSGSFTDADAGDVLTLSARRADGGALPAWLSFDAKTGTFSGTPPRFADPVEVSVRATDRDGLSVADSFVLTVTTPGTPSSGAITFFSANDGSGGQELWITDGTPSGTRQVADLNPSGGSGPRDFTAIGGGKFVFGAFGGATGFELWVTDGTAGGTSLLKDIGPGALDGNPSLFTAIGGGKAVFRAYDGTRGGEVWVTDGTRDGTSLVKDVRPGPDSSGPIHFAAIGGGNAVFRANDGTTGNELWITDGTPQGTRLLKDIRPGVDVFGSSGSLPRDFLPVAGGKTVFSAADAASGNELWITDGTTAGTSLLLDLRPGSNGAYPVPALAMAGGKVIFTANTQPSGRELWVTDGTADGTYLLKDIRPGVGGSYPDFPRAIGGGKAVFVVSDGTNAASWLTDGTGPPPGLGVFDPWHEELWVTDGTKAGTQLLKDTGLARAETGPPSLLTAVGNGKLVFFAEDPSLGRELWITDGTPNGTSLLKDIRPGAMSGIDRYTGTVPVAIAGGQVAFLANDGTHGEELWITDGTAPGTIRWADFRPGALTPADFVTILPNASPTLAAPIADVSMRASKAFSFQIQASSFSDPDMGDALTLSATRADGGALPSWLSFDATTRSFSGTPPIPVGALALRVTATDILGASVSDEFQLNLLNSSPILATPLPHAPLEPGTAISLKFGSSFADADAAQGLDTLSYSATPDGGGALPSWLSLDTASGVLSGIVPSDRPSRVLLHVTATDEFGASASGVLTIGNRAPAIAPLADVAVAANKPFGFALPAASFTDPDIGETLTLSARLTNGNALPSWLSFDAATRTFFGAMPSPAISIDVRVTVEDRDGLGAFDDFRLSPPTPRTPKTLFSADDGSTGRELWVTDGTATGTQLLKNLNTGPLGGVDGRMGSFPRYFAPVDGGRAVFSAQGTTGYGLWITDGTSAGTSELKDTGFVPSLSTAVGNGQVVFLQIVSNNHTGDVANLWITDGSPAGTIPVPGLQLPGFFTAFAPVGENKLVFSASTAAAGNDFELWITDGTKNGTSLLKDVAPGPGSSTPAYFAALGDGRTVFGAEDATSGRELWITDGTPDGTTLVRDVQPGPADGIATRGSGIWGFSFKALGNGKALFTGNDGTSGHELWVTDGTSAGTTLVKDIRPGGASSEAQVGAVLGNGKAIVSVVGGTSGRELWVTDGTADGTYLLKDVLHRPTRNNGGNGYFYSVALGNGKAVFTADDGTSGRELWVTDGTPAGTARLVDINPGPANSEPEAFAAIGDGKVVFSAANTTSGRELWITDGTVAGTSLLRDIRLGAGDSSPGSFATVLLNSAPALVAPLPHAPLTAGGVIGLNVSSSFSDPDAVRGFDSLTFSATLANGDALPQWLGLDPTTGLLSGTVPTVTPSRVVLRVTAMDEFGAVATDVLTLGNRPPVLVPLADAAATAGMSFSLTIPAGRFTDPDAGDVLSLSARLSSGATLPSWLSFDPATRMFSGTPPRFAPSLEVRVTATDRDGSSVSDDFNLAVTTRQPVVKTLFVATAPGSGRELWVTDGTTAGTSLVKDILPGSGTSNAPAFITGLGNGKAVFSASGGTASGAELWITDGTTAGTSQLKDIVAGAGSSGPREFSLLGNGKTLFAANATSLGAELHVTDGTATGTSLVKDIRPGSLGSFPDGITALGNGKAVFFADDGASGRELWITDGTSVGTSLLRDIKPGSSGSSDTSNFVALGDGRALFVASEADVDRLWVTGGTAASTVNLRSAFSPSPSGEVIAPSQLAAFATGKALFSASDRAGGNELWITDGTEAGTAVVLDIFPGTTGSHPRDFTGLGNGKAVFSASSPTIGREIWITDGTQAGTAVVRDISVGGAGSDPRDFTKLGNGKAIFSATTASNGRELWITDGTADGTTLLKDIVQGTRGSDPVGFAALGDGRVVFSAFDATSGREPWITDGTAAGTARLKDISGGATGSTPSGFVVIASNSAPVVVAPLPGPLLQRGEGLHLDAKTSFSDADVAQFRDSLRFSATVDGGALPPWLTMDQTTGVLSGTVPLDGPASLALRVTAMDEAGESASATRMLSIAGASLEVSGPAAQIAEGGAGITVANFTVTRSGDASGAASVSWAVAGSGSNPASAADFAGGAFPSGTLDFAPGQTTRTIDVQIAGDASIEPDETFALTLSDPSGATLGGASVVATILNDDFAPSGVSGMVYHWKSHVLLSDVKLSTAGSVQSLGKEQLLEIRGLSLDENGALRFDIYAQAGRETGNFDFDLRVRADGPVIWNASRFPGWSIEAVSGEGRLTVAAAGTEALRGEIKLGSAMVELTVAAEEVQVEVLSANVGDGVVKFFSKALMSRVTGAGGDFALSDIPDDVADLSVARSAADTGGAISSADALAALKLAVGRNPNTDPDGAGPLQAKLVSPYQLIAADVTGDGRVTSADALAILKMAVGRADAPARDWIFVREDEDFWNETAGSLTIHRNDVSYAKAPHAIPAGGAESLDFVGVLKGDVNGSWAASGSGIQTLDPQYFVALSQAMGAPLDLWG